MCVRNEIASKRLGVNVAWSVVRPVKNGTFCSRTADVELLREHGRIFARNLPFDTSEDDLEALFSEHGAISELILPLDSDSRRGKGFAYVQYESFRRTLWLHLPH